MYDRVFTYKWWWYFALFFDTGGHSIESVEDGIVKPIAFPSIEEENNQVTKEGTRNEWDILKSIVYGGLIESITSLGVVSSAAGSDASTCKFIASIVLSKIQEPSIYLMWIHAFSFLVF